MMKARALRERRRRKKREDAERDWQRWLHGLFPGYFTAPFAPHHEEFWEHIWDARPNEPHRPFIAVWPRGGGKSTAVEAAAVVLGAPRFEDYSRAARQYVLYVSDTQQQADDHVQTISSLLEAQSVASYFPGLADRKLSKYGHARAWRRNRLITRSGYVIDAMGLDSARRGAKLEELRPDVIILDDVDTESDSPQVVEKKLEQIKKKILPAGASNVFVVGAQNLVHENSIFSRLCGDAEFLVDRIVSGPIPAVRNLETRRTYDDDLERTRDIIVGGEPTWDGMDLDACQREIDRFGLTAFKQECQHDVEDLGGGIFDDFEFERCAIEDVPWSDLVRVVCWMDPAVTSTSASDCMAIQIDALAEDGTIYRLYSWEAIDSPEQAMRRALLKAVEYGAQKVGVETDQGGDTWKTVYQSAWTYLVNSGEYPQISNSTRRPTFDEDKASKGHGSKDARGYKMLSGYETTRIIHVRGTHKTLERALNRAFVSKPFDLADAAYYAWNDLASRGRGRAWSIN